MTVSWSAFKSDPPAVGDFAAFMTAIAAEPDNLGLLDAHMEIPAEPTAWTSTAGSVVRVKSPDNGPFFDIKLTENVNGLTINPETVLTTTLAARNVRGSAVITVADATGVEVGHFCDCDGDLSQFRYGEKPDYIGDQLDQGFKGRVIAVDGNTVTLDQNAMWEFEPNRAITLIAEAGQEKFLYHSVRIAASNTEVLVNDVVQTPGVDFVFSGPDGNDPETAPSALGIWATFATPMTGGERVTFRMTTNAVVTFIKSGQVTFESLRFVADSKDHPQKILIRDGTLGMRFNDVEFVATNQVVDTNGRPTFGGVQFITHTGYDLKASFCEFTGGGYATFPSGSRFELEDCLFFNCWTPTQKWFYGDRLTVRRVQFSHCRTSLGGHGGHDVTGADLTVVDTPMNMRSEAAVIDGLLAYGTWDVENIFSLSYGNSIPGHIPEMENQRDNPAWLLSNVDKKPCQLTNARIEVPEGQTGSLICIVSDKLTLTDVRAPDIDLLLTGDAGLPFRNSSLAVSDVTFRLGVLRFALAVSGTDLHLNDQLSITTDAGLDGGISVNGGSVDLTDSEETTPIDDRFISGGNTQPRALTNFVLTAPDAVYPTTDQNAVPAYDFTGTVMFGSAFKVAEPRE